MAMPDAACREIDVSGTHGTARYSTGRDGTFQVDDPRHARRLREEGAFPANLGGTPLVTGFPCRQCNFQSLFIRCSRCGTENPREE